MANGIADNLTAYLAEPSLALPHALTIEAMATQAVEWVATQGGATFNLFFGNMTGQSLYAVSVYPEHSVVIPGPAVEDAVLRRYIEDNLDLLTDPRNSIGLWYSDTLQAIYLDVSVTLPDKASAVLLGERYNQEAIYDLGLDEVLDTGGTGEWQEGWADEASRLPPLQKRKETENE